MSQSDTGKEPVSTVKGATGDEQPPSITLSSEQVGSDAKAIASDNHTGNRAASERNQSQSQTSTGDVNPNRDAYVAGGNISQTVIIAGSTSEAMQEVRKFIGTTTTLRSSPKPTIAAWQRTAPNINVAAIPERGSVFSRAKEGLARQRFVVVQSELPALAEDLVLHVSSTLQLQDRVFETRFLPAQFASDVDYAALDLDGFLREISTIERKSMLVLNLDSIPEKDCRAMQLELARAMRQKEGARIAQVLAERQMFCIFLSGHSKIQGGGAHDHFDFIAYSLVEEEDILIGWAASKIKETPELFSTKLREQIDQGVWGDPGGRRLEALYDDIRDDKITARVEENVKTSLNQARAAFTARLEALLGTLQPSHNNAVTTPALGQRWSASVVEGLIAHTLFALTHFDGLTASEFDWLMRRLLKGKISIETEEVIEVTSVENLSTSQPNHVPVTGTDESRRIRLIERNVALDDVYNADPDRVLTMLDVQLHRNGQLVFQPPFKAKIAEEFFRSKRAVFANRLLSVDTIDGMFLFAAEHRLAEKFAKAYSAFIMQLPEASRERCLIEWMSRSAHHFIEQRVPNLSRAGAPAPLRWLAEMVETEERGRLSKEFAERMCLVLVELLRGAETRPLVNITLDNLMIEGQRTRGRFEIIMQFIRQLRRHEGFSTLHWLKRLLSEGDDDAKREALKFLINVVEAEWREGPLASDGSLLKALRGWIPERMDKESGLNSQTGALLAPRLAMHQSLLRVPERDHGKIERIEPLIDLQSITGLARDADIAIELLNCGKSGAWGLFDLGSIERLLRLRWQVDTSRGRSYSEEESETIALALEFPILSYLVDPSDAVAWVSKNWGQLGVVTLLIETLSALISEKGHDIERRLGVSKELMRRVASVYDRDAVYSMSSLAYSFYKGLQAQRSDEAYRRGRCAKLLGDELWDLHRDRASNSVRQRKEG